jgi:DNA helicase IV
MVKTMETDNNGEFIKIVSVLERRISELNDFRNKKYISSKEVNQIQVELGLISEHIKTNKKWYKFFSNLKITKKIDSFRQSIQTLLKDIKKDNQRFLEEHISTLNNSILSVNGRPLDIYQSSAAIVDEENVLVIAGAGTGKTSTILGKLKYLLIQQRIDPEDILVLTYTKATAEDMKNKVHKETGQNIDIFTFHKLGRDIIVNVEKKDPRLTSLNLRSFVIERIKELCDKNPIYFNKLVDYLFLNQHALYKEPEFSSLSEYQEYVRLNPYITMNKEKVKSREEVAIANFFFINKIKYEYEKLYSLEENVPYHPDFYLPEYDIWIEHFAVSRDNQVPSFFKSKRSKTAKDTYLEEMKIKISTHAKNRTRLIETYSYQAKEGILFENLKKQLDFLGIKFDPMSHEELTKEIDNLGPVMNGMAELFASVIQLSKMRSFTLDSLKELPMTVESGCVRNLVLPVFELYLTELSKNSEIDFTDMLLKSIDYVNAGKFNRKYKYVIIDEFQDMTNLTFSLIQAMRDKNRFKLFCVGDDWQSIYRFAGSNISYITEFEKYFGPSEIFQIRKTYRFPQSLADLSSAFIIKNPRQIRKQIISHKDSNFCGFGILDAWSDSVAIMIMASKLTELPHSSRVMFIGRYNDDIHMLKSNKDFSYKFNQGTNSVQVTFKPRTDLKIVFISAHSSKGFESEYVFVINNKHGSYGFPSMIQDNPILDYFLDEKDSYRFAEERRLYYVALTRAITKVWLLVNERNKSVFIEEIERDFSEELKKEQFECPQCGRSLNFRNGRNGRFIGCSGYPECRYSRSILTKRNQ